MSETPEPERSESPQDAPFRYVVGSNELQTTPCEVCQQPTNPWRLTLAEGSRRCPACLESLAHEKRLKSRRWVVVGGTALAFLLIVGVAVGFSYTRYRVSPAYSLDQLQDALYGGSTIVTNRHLDDETVMAELVSAYVRHEGDDDVSSSPTVAFAIENIPEAIAMNAFVAERDGRNAKVITVVPGLMSDRLFYVELHMLMEPTTIEGEEVWRITHATNADDFISSLINGTPNSDLTDSVSD